MGVHLCQLYIWIIQNIDKNKNPKKSKNKQTTTTTKQNKLQEVKETNEVGM